MTLEQLVAKLRPFLQTHGADEVVNLSLEIENESGVHFQIESDDIGEDVLHLITTTYSEIE